MCVGLVGLGALATQLSSCAPLPVLKGESKDGIITVPIISFTEKSNVMIVRNAQLDFDIALVKNSDSDYTALLMKCTHQDNPLSLTKNGLYCASHGSAFDLKGNVTQEPALTPLKKFTTEITNSSILINTKS
ncbi:MAG: Rieske (2Fe-2S) protein [Bacteroidetes bacterium]|nr:Rieske (2Fe-2S) protein [Bacteroidota bacterium]